MIPAGSEYVYVRNHPQHLEFGRLCAEHESAAYPRWVGRFRSQVLRNLFSLLFSVGKPRRKLFIVEAPGGLSAVLLRRARGGRILMINADPTLFRLEKARGINRFVTRLLISRVDGFLSPATLMADLAARQFPGKAHAIFDMYVDTSLWRPLPPEKRSGDFLYIGRADRYKNQAFLVQVFRRIREKHRLDIRLNVVGNIHPEYESEMRPLLDDRVAFTGWISQPWKHVPAAGYYFNLAVLEPSGTNILEALALGLIPIVSTGCGYGADVIARLDPRLVVPLEEDEVVAAWEHLHFMEPAAREALRAKCLETAAQWDRRRAHARFQSAVAECLRAAPVSPAR